MAISTPTRGGQMPRTHARSSLSERIDPRNNSINALRLGLAFCVLLSHSIKFSTGGEDFIGSWTGSAVDFGTMGVDGFFALSGYLIVGSYLSSRSTGRYLWRRCLRILPAFWVCLVVTALAIGPLTALFSSGTLGDYAWTGPNSALTYMRDNALLLIRQFHITGGYGGEAVNGSLYTLFYEFLCYLAVAAAGMLGLYRLRRSWVGILVIAGWLLALLAVFAAPTLLLGHPSREVLLRFGSMFLFGGLAHFFAHRIRVSPAGYLAAAGALAVGLSGGIVLSGSGVSEVRGLLVYILLAPPAIAYIVLGLGASTRLAKIGSKRDLSYGLYVYAWPAQVTLVVLGAADWWQPLFIATTLALSLSLAYVSWTVIEAPALRLKSWSPSRKRFARVTTPQRVPDDTPAGPAPTAAQAAAAAQP